MSPISLYYVGMAPVAHWFMKVIFSGVILIRNSKSLPGLLNFTLANLQIVLILNSPLMYKGIAESLWRIRAPVIRTRGPFT
jgi:hypothetical protein